MASHSAASRTFQRERFCRYIHRYCNQTRLEGYDFCIRHILEDKNAPFKQCMYVNQPNKKRCTNAAPKNEKNEKRDNLFCPFHAKRAMLKVRISAPKKKTVKGPAAFLKSLEHYCLDSNHDPSYKRDSLEKSDVFLCKGGSPASLSDLDCAIDAEHPLDSKARLDNIDDDLSWVEKQSDCLENAGVFTHKEILTIAKEKILNLQQLYCQELKVVYHQLRESRRQFLADLNLEKTDGSTQITDEANKSQLHALKHYHRHSGVERVLRHKVRSKRSSDVNSDSTKQICSFKTDDKQCENVALMATKYCKTHILLDTKQLLFKPCPLGVKKECKKPVLVFDEEAACDLHLHRLLKSKLSQPRQPSPTSDIAESIKIDPEPFQSMDDIASLGLDSIYPTSLFGLDQFGEPGESTDTVLSEDQADLMQIQPISPNPPADILSDSRKSDSE